MYECTQDETTTLYTVARIKGTSADADTTDESTDSTEAEKPLPNLTKTEVKEGEVTLADGVELEKAAVTLTGLSTAITDKGVEKILDSYAEENNIKTDDDTPVVEDGTEMTLTVKAEVKTAEENNVKYDVKPYAAIDGTEVPIDNTSLNDRSMTLSFYTGFLPAEVYHIHDDGTVDTYNQNEFTYNAGNGMVTINISSFSEVRAVDSETAFKTAITTTAAEGDTVQLSENITLTDDESISIGKNLTINLNGHTLSRTNTTATYAMFKITNGATLTIVGNNVANSKLEITDSTAVAAGYIANIESGSLVLGDQGSVTNKATFTASAPATGTGANVTTVDVRCATTSFDPGLYCKAPYRTESTESPYDVGEYAVELTRVTTPAIGTTGKVTETKPYETLTAALAAVESKHEADVITLLRDINLSATGETSTANLNQRVIIDGAEYTITGDIGVMTKTGDTMLTATKTLKNVTVTGNININAAAFKLSNATVTGNVTDSGSSELEFTDAKISSKLTVGNASNLKFTSGTVNSVTAADSTTDRKIEISSVTVGENADGSADRSIAVGTKSDVTLYNVNAGSLTVAGAPETTTATATTNTSNPSVSVKNSKITTVSIGANMLKVTLDGLNANTVSVADGSGNGKTSIEVKSSAINGATSIGTLTIGANCGTPSITGHTADYNTYIGALSIGANTHPTLGTADASGTGAKDGYLTVDTVTSAGTTTINSGTYGPNMTTDAAEDSLIVSPDSAGTFKLKGGNYHKDYRSYCACELNSENKYDHYQCTLGSDGRYHVSKLEVKLVSVTPESVVRGSKTQIKIVVNVPYMHMHEDMEKNNVSVLGVNYLDTRLSSTVPLSSTDYKVTSENPDDLLSNSVITISGDYVARNPYQTYSVNTEMGNVSATATVDTQLARTSRSGLIRTGDDSNIGLLIGIMVLTLAVVVAVVVILKKKKTQTSAPAQPEAKAKEPKKKKDKKDK